MKVRIFSKTKKGEDALRSFQKKSKNALVMKLVGLKVETIGDKPFSVECTARIFKGQPGAINISKTYQMINTYWLPELQPKKDYEVKVI